MIRLAVRVRQDQAEIVLAELLELAPSGVEEVSLADGVVEYAVYGPPGELPVLPDLRAAAGEALVEITTSEIADDWVDRWRSFHKPLVLDGRLTVRPPWEPATGATALDVVIDPGQAFGTGAHASTRLCLELLLAVASRSEERGSLVDLGCGSGVLAIVAALLGWGPVVALDFDPVAVGATAENCALNGVEVDARRFDVRASQVPAASVVVANLVTPLLLEWAESGGAWPETLVVSGVLAREGDRVAGAFAEQGYVERERRSGGEWVALLLGG